jgi:mannose-6-phosphate isomerase-like protein (cupin superfamily)
MAQPIRVLTLKDDAEVVRLDHLTSRRLVRKTHGSNTMSFNVSTLEQGYDDREVQYADYDEIFYILAGEAEIEFDGGRHLLAPGMAVFVPRGSEYAYRVTKGPNELVAVFSPARS